MRKLDEKQQKVEKTKARPGMRGRRVYMIKVALYKKLNIIHNPPMTVMGKKRLEKDPINP